jgi:hypothetical protein
MFFPFSLSWRPNGKMKPSCSSEATPAPVSQLASTLLSSAPYCTARTPGVDLHVNAAPVVNVSKIEKNDLELVL